MALKSQTFNISLPRDLVKRADKVAEQEYRSRSELIKEALRTYLDKNEAWNLLMAEGRKKGVALGLDSDEKAMEAAIEAVDEHRLAL